MFFTPLYFYIRHRLRKWWAVVTAPKPKKRAVPMAPPRPADTSQDSNLRHFRVLTHEEIVAIQKGMKVRERGGIDRNEPVV